MRIIQFKSREQQSEEFIERFKDFLDTAIENNLDIEFDTNAEFLTTAVDVFLEEEATRKREAFRLN